MGKKTTRRKPRGPARPRSRRRRSAVGALLGAALIAGLAGLGYFFLSQPSQQLGASDLVTIEQALSNVPDRDVTGPDLGFPRPVGSTRSYFHQSGKVSTTMFSRHGGFEEVRDHLVADVPAAGWGGLPASSPAPVPSEKNWSSLYAKPGKILQVTVLFNKDVTATMFVLQDDS